MDSLEKKSMMMRRSRLLKLKIFYSYRLHQSKKFLLSPKEGTQYIDTGLSLEILFVSTSSKLHRKFELLWLYFVFNKHLHFLQSYNLEIPSYTQFFCYYLDYQYDQFLVLLVLLSIKEIIINMLVMFYFR